MSAAEVNIPLLRKAVEWAEAEAAKPPGQCLWLQAEWMTFPEDHKSEHSWSAGLREENGLTAECGTTHCIAGWIGATMGDGFDRNWVNAEGVAVEEFAAEALGLSRCDAMALFRGTNTIEDVRRIAESLAGEPL